MDENSAMVQQVLREEENDSGRNGDINEWKTVSYSKRNRKPSKPHQPGSLSFDPHNGGVSSDVFSSIEKHSEDRRRRAAESVATVEAEAAVSSAVSNGLKFDYEDDSDPGAEGENGAVEFKKVKQKKPKKPKVTVAEAALKIDAGDLCAFLFDITSSYETQQDIQLMRFADYFGRAFASVSAAQFPWLKIFKEYTVSKLVDIPLSNVPEDVYRISVDWLNRRSSDAVVSFVLWSLDSILADLASHHGTTKGSKKVTQQAPSKSLVAIFLVLSMALRRKPDVLINLEPTLREDTKYQGQYKLPIIVWMIAQATQGDLAVGLYMWVHVLLPMLSGTSSCNPQSRDLILQLIERIISSPKARPILVNGAVRKGDRLVPPSALDILMRITFPAPSARVKATERFEAIYPTLKEVSLAGSPGSKAMKQVAQKILNYAVKAAGEGVPELSKEASDIFIWCLTKNPECYKQWDDLYIDNLEASVAVLRRLANEWKEHSVKHSTVDPLRETLKSFRLKNEKAEVDSDALLKEADKYCKLILGHLSQGHGCLKGVLFASIALAAGLAFMSQNVQPLSLDKLSTIFNQS
ncbi:hypothetical protein F3Y22_tig00111398pilonHSYRG00421 [Hibiscus syriacus]|uniref:Uncharacterized protein n=1 Tax=Hibiscus syriacus TaxID=106335 RepID=A0A6A2YLH0_HIBSY|nr:uncharacterized protein LOC120160999 isoform X2 [Hibiscus syriacus]KAE8679734.1 hypothetical protein F3Y22_tig00111398pilonHSYRG00421 [Hibiscus syriacus]